MDSFTALSARKKILRNSRLKGCFLLITIAFIPLIIALVFSQSMMEGIRDKYISLSDGHIKSLDYVEPSDAVFSCDRIKSGYAIIYSDSNNSNILVKGIDKDYFNSKRSSQIHFSERPQSNTNLNKISISRTTAKNLNVKEGDKVALMIVPSDSKVKVRPVLMEIQNIFYTGYDQLDKNIAFVDYSVADKSFENQETYEILLNSPYSSNAFDAAMNIGLKNFITWDMNNVSVYSNFVTSSQMILLILILITAIAAYYVFMITNQIINDDIKEIAILKMIGTSDSEIRKINFISVFAITISGIIAGTFLGIIVSYSIVPLLSKLSSMGIELFSYYLLDFDIILPLKEILIICFTMAFLCIVSIIISLHKTKKIKPLELFTNQ